MSEFPTKINIFSLSWLLEVKEYEYHASQILWALGVPENS
jgi:hypothetical protein